MYDRVNVDSTINMRQRPSWMSAADASTLLGVSRTTLYAYVSRGFVRSQATPGPSRERRYSRDDVERLQRRTEERRNPDKAVAHALSRTKAVKSACRSGRIRYDTRGFRRERLVRAGSNLSRTMGAAIPADIRISPAIARFLRQTAKESGIRRPVFRSFRVSFPRVTGSPEIARLHSRRRNRTIHMVIGGRVAGSQSARHGVSAIIVTIEAGRIAHVRRVHSR